MPLAMTRPRSLPSCGPDHGRVGRAVALPDADEGLDDAAALDLMVVLADDIFAAADVEAAEHGFEEGPVVRDLGLGGVNQSNGGCLRAFRTSQTALRLQLGRAVMQEGHVQVGHDLVSIRTCR
jgi:hypothetical protein